MCLRLLFIFVLPQLPDACGDLRFGGVAGVRLVEFLAFERFGHELQPGESAVVVGVFIAFAVPRLIHQLGRGVAQVQGYGPVGRIVFDEGERLVDGHVGRVALGRGGQVDRGFV